MITKKVFIITSGIFIGSILPAFFSGLNAQVKPAKLDSITVKNNADIIPGRTFNTTSVSNTAAISTVTSCSLTNINQSLTNQLYGLLSGATVIQGSGEPSFDAAKINIRGIGTYANLGGAYNQAAIFVDGFQVEAGYLNYLPSSQIESISVLKDAASLVTFGQNGANGVIWVVTKQPVVGKQRVEFNAQYGFASAQNINKPLNSYQYANLYNQAASNDNGNVWKPTYTPAQLQAYQDGTGTNVDWYDQALRSSTPYSSGNLLFSGGDKNVRYNVLFDYLNQNGLYKVNNADATSNELFNKYNVAGNLAFNWDIFEAKVGITARLEDRQSPNYTSNYQTTPIWNDLASYPNNIYPVYDDALNTHYSGTPTYKNNPVGTQNGLGWQSNQTRYIMANFSLKEKLDFITKGLYLNEAASFYTTSLRYYNKTATYARYIGGVPTTTDVYSSTVASGLGAVSQADWKQGIITLGYENQFGKSHLNAALNYNVSEYRGENVLNYADHNENYTGRFNYAYDNRYVAEVGFSYYGNDAYSPQSRWGFYPAVSGAWIASNESFLKNNPVVNFLKVRASYGQTANDNAGSNIANNGRYLYTQYYVGGGTYYTGNSTPAGQGGLTQSYLANPNLGPEVSLKTNVGLEMTLFKKLDLSMDYYVDKRSGIVTVNNSIPSDFGNNTMYSNIGKMTSSGVEATATLSDKIGDFSYKIMGMASYNQNTIDYQAEIAPAYAYNATTGRAYGTPIGLIAAGFYQTTDFNTDGTLKSGIPVPTYGPVQAGDIKYQDLNNDNRIDQTDITAIGKPSFPELYYSFGVNLAYKGFDIKVLFQGTEGSSVSYMPQPFINNSTAYAIALGAWAYYPDQNIDTRNTATFPRLTLKGNANNYRSSTFWMHSGDYLKLRNVELGYTLPEKVMKSLKFSKLRLFVNATNPLTWSSLLTNYHIDPETMSGYPGMKSVNVGLTANF